jgi:hypothetical protein
MNKSDIVEIMSKKTSKLAVLSVLFVGMMAFLVPALIDKADARTAVTITSTAGPFYNTDVHLVNGKFWSSPSYIPREFPMVVKWISWGGGIIGGGDELGRFTGTVNLPGIGPDPRVSFEYFNPTFNGGNECKVTRADFPLVATCHIPPNGWSVSATFTVSHRNQVGDNNYCDIQAQSGGFEQTEKIREKLRC